MLANLKKLTEIKEKNNISKNIIDIAKLNIELLHRQQDGFITLAGKENTHWVQHHYKYSELYENIEKALNLHANLYITPNSFWKPQRKIEYIRHLNSLFIDVDFYKIEKYKNKNHLEVMEIIKKDIFNKNMLPSPTFALYTGRGLAFYWLIEPCPVTVLPLWNVVQRYFLETLEIVGGDAKSIDSARVMKLAGSLNLSNNTRAKLYIFDKNLIYKLGDIQKNYLPELSPDTESVGDRVHKRKHLTREEYFKKINEQKSTKGKTKKQKKVINLYNQLNLHYSRLMDLVKLLEVRNGMCREEKGALSPKGQRETMCFLYRYWYCCYCSDEDMALEYTLEFNQSFREPLTNDEVINITNSAVKAYREWQEDENIKNDLTLTDEEKKKRMGKKVGDSRFFHKGYNYTNAKLIKMLGITEDEMKEMKTIISKKVKLERQFAKEKASRRNEEGLTPKQKEKKDRQEKILNLAEQGLNITEIVKETGLSRFIISRDIKYLKDNGLLQT